VAGETVFLTFSTGYRAWDGVNPDFFKYCLQIKHGAKPISVSNDTRNSRGIPGSPRFRFKIGWGGGDVMRQDRLIAGQGNEGKIPGVLSGIEGPSNCF
jgi:hypothetical protein